ncbi:MAG: YhgE/Pip family protein, partial [Eggerthellaceae bacterium]|nr:YhgE/Pip family protein [Eggerthellaceae bacterium]
MKTSFGIFLRDLKALVRNPAAFLVIIALLVLPGLYAWYCIVANWEPYANTGNIPIAIVCEDEGVSNDVVGDINIGEQVTEKLRDNHDINWRFYDTADEALEATRTLECYAAIVMPKDLSKNVVGIFDGSGDPPAIYYYPNEKKSAVAVKVTDSAAQTLVTQINQQFASTVNETVLEKVQEGSDQVGEQTDKTRRTLANDVEDTRAQIDEVTETLDSAIDSIDGWRASVAGAQTALATAAEQMPLLQASLSESSANLNNLRTKTAEFDAVFSKSLSQTNLVLANLSLRISSDLGAAESDMERVGADLDKSIELLTIEIEAHGPTEVTEHLVHALQRLQEASDRLDTAVALANASAQGMNDSVQRTVDKANAANEAFSRDVLPTLSNGTYELGMSLSSLSSAIGQFEPQIAELQEVLSQTDAALVDAIAAIEQAKALLAGIDSHLESTSTDLNAMGSALQVDELAKLLDIDPDNLGQFISSPVNLVTEEIYPVSNYGTAVAPFYTSLALWIGCFILISLIKLEVDRTGFEEATPTQRYFGRWLLLMLLAVIQSQIICGVDILLGIDCAHPIAFMAAGAVCSFAFMNLLYALALAFRNIGRTLCILLLIMQVPGSSGMYPIEMMPAFFRAIHPALPFTYSIDAMREALCGMQGTAYFADLAVIALIIPLGLFIGLVLRRFMMNLLVMFDEELRKTGLFAGEEHGQGLRNERMRSLFRALISHDSYQGYIEERAWSFSRRYPRLRKVGSFAVFAIPFALLVIMLPFNLVFGSDVSTDTKLMALIAALVLVLIVQVCLILLEYARRIAIDETKLLGNEQLAEAYGYSTIIEKVDDKRRAAEDERAQTIEQMKNGAIDDLFSAAPPLPSSLASSTAEVGGFKPVVPIGQTDKPKRYGGAARDIFFTDMRLGFQSVIGVVVIMLLVITPSLYAWFNIAGSWDPYSNTGNLKVAVANMDEGYKSELVPVRVNMGDTIVSQMRSNESFNWVFVDEQHAVDGVTDSTYYAAIVIPEDFSRNMMTYLVDDAKYPDVIYYTNEKENPIAPIITQKGANSIQENIRCTFTERLDEIVLSMASDLTDYTSKPQVENYFNKMSRHFDDAIRDLENGGHELNSLSNLSGTVANVVATAGSAMNGIRNAGATARTAMTTAETGARDAANAFEQASAVIETALADSENELLLIEGDVDEALTALESGTTEVPTVIYDSANAAALAAEAAHATARVEREAAELIVDPVEREKALAEAARIDAIGTSFDNLSTSLTAMADRAGQLDSNVEQTRAEVAQLIADADAAIAEARSF